MGIGLWLECGYHSGPVSLKLGSMFQLFCFWLIQPWPGQWLLPTLFPIVKKSCSAEKTRKRCYVVDMSLSMKCMKFVCKTQVRLCLSTN